jgi:hypothetical protein
MYVTRVNENEMWKALGEVNKRFDNNVDFFIMERRNGKLHFRLKTISNKEPGHTLGYPRKYYNKKYDEFLNSVKRANGIPEEPEYLTKQSNFRWACWHVHGYFFEELFKINPKAKVYSGGKKITVDEGNWEDWVISSFHGMRSSDLCNCKKEGIA